MEKCPNCRTEAADLRLPASSATPLLNELVELEARLRRAAVSSVDMPSIHYRQLVARARAALHDLLNAGAPAFPPNRAVREDGRGPDPAA